MPHIAGFRGVLPDPSKRVPADAAELGKGLAAGTLVRDPGRAIYRYHQVFAGPGRSFTRKNVIVAVRLSPWADGVMRPHEATTQAARDAALARIRRDGAHTEPIVAGFRDQPGEVERLLRRSEGGAPTLETTTADGTSHRLWRIQDSELLGKLRNFLTPKKLHLLEGHDRYEGMLAYQAELAAKQPLAMYSSANYALACLVNLEDPALVTTPRHRVIRGITGTPAELLAKARAHFLVEPLPGAAKDLAKQQAALADSVAHQPAFVVVFAGEADAWKLTLSPDVSAFSEGVAPHRALQKLDPVVVDGLFVGRVLPGAQVSTLIDVRGALAALEGGAAAAIIVRPLSVEQIAHVDELGQLLPPESTGFYPPIAAGLVSMVIDPDEDLV